MRLVTFRGADGTAKPGLLQDDSILDLASAGFSDAVDAIRQGAEALQRAAAAGKAQRIPSPQAQLLAPIPKPPRIFCVGLNYRDHAIESKMEIPKVPTIFIKLPSAVIGPEAEVRIPSITKQPDYEAEFAIVIGKPGRRIAAEQWQEHVFGYTILNDVSA